MKNRKFISIIISFILLIGTIAVPSAFATDNNVPDGFTGIYNNEDLNAIRNNPSGKYILMNDIDLSSVANWQPIGDETSPFTGVFYGNGYAIKNMSISITTDMKYDVKKCGIGLFGQIDGAVIANTNLENVSISINYPFEVDYPAGAIAGICHSSKILDCSASGNIKSTLGGGYNLGGIVGLVTGKGDSLIANCINNTNIDVVGELDENAFGFAVAYTVEIGGIAGSVYQNNVISRCFNNGTINIEPIPVARAGGIVGSAYYNAPIIDCGNTGDITVTDNAFAGGICGYSHSITNCYNAGSITVTNADFAMLGGIAGATKFRADDDTKDKHINATDAEIANCYYINELNSAISNADAGVLTSVKALNAEEMKNQSSYAGFDFENVWTLTQGNTPTIKNAASNLLIEKVEIAAGETIPLPPQVINIEISNNKVATLDSEGNVKGNIDGEATIEIITAEGKYQIIEVSVVEENGIFEGIKRRIVLLFISAFEFFFSLFNKA